MKPMYGSRWSALLLTALLACDSPEAAPRAAAPPGDGQKATGSFSAVPDVASHPELTPTLRPILSAIAEAQSELRPDSGTLAADSAFLRWRRELATRVEQVASRFSDTAFQADVWPSGAAAMARWQEHERAERRATPEEQARSDSLIALLESHGIWSRHSEGDTYFALNETLLLERMGPYLTRGMHDLLALEAEEQRRPFAEDAALVISLDELARRIRWTEQHLEEYPSSISADEMRLKYHQYLLRYLNGLDNTPAFDRRTNTLVASRREHMQQYAGRYSSSASGRLVSEYLALLEDNGYRRTTRSDELIARLRLGEGPHRKESAVERG